MTNQSVSGIQSDDPGVARILAAMSAGAPTAGATAEGPGRPAGAAAPVGESSPAPARPILSVTKSPTADPVSPVAPAPDPDVTSILAAVSARGPGLDGQPSAGPQPLPLLAGGYRPPPAAALPDGRTAGATDVVTCPECGQLATVNMARRSADDFCRTCDFPLFWAKGTVITPDGEESGASLRRLPGTVGRAATAALICPHCSEPNSPTAEICVRCALSLHPVDIPEPEPQPEPMLLFEPAPEPEPEPAPDSGFDWWWVVAVVMAVVAIALIVVLVVLQ